MAYQSFVSLEPWTIIIQAANLALLFLILKRLLFKPVQAILDRRKNEANAVFEEASIEKKKAQDLHSRYAAKMDGAEREMRVMLENTEKEIRHMQAEALERAKGEAAHIRENAKRQTELERCRARDQLQVETAVMAFALAEKMLCRQINPQDRQRMIEEFMESTEIGS